MATFHFELASPERLVFSGEVEQVDVPGSEGDFGVLAGHAPLVTILRPGIMTVYAGGEKQQIVVLGGFARRPRPRGACGADQGNRRAYQDDGARLFA